MTIAVTYRFTLADVARMWTEERARQKGMDPTEVRPVTAKTVSANIAWSRPAAPGRPPNRYQNNPMPLPRYPEPDKPIQGQHPYWEPEPGETIEDLERRIRDWWSTGRVGRGRPGLRRAFVPRPGRRRWAPCPCGSGLKVAPGKSCERCVYATEGAPCG